MDLKQLVEESLTYNPATGEFRWKIRPPHHFATPRARNIINSRNGGRIAGSPGGQGYFVIGMMNRIYSAHRIAWLIVHGSLPEFDIDHINGDRLDNRIENLRPATRSENICNSKIRKNNTSGIKGVSWNRLACKWRADLRINGVRTFIGQFRKIEDAEAAVREARVAFHGKFTNHG